MKKVWNLYFASFSQNTAPNRRKFFWCTWYIEFWNFIESKLSQTASASLLPSTYHLLHLQELLYGTFQIKRCCSDCNKHKIEIDQYEKSPPFPFLGFYFQSLPDCLWSCHLHHHLSLHHRFRLQDLHLASSTIDIIWYDVVSRTYPFLIKYPPPPKKK